MKDIQLLDCTLRDGGYINEWKWGFDKARTIIRLLAKSKTDVIEVGFLRNVQEYDENITIGNKIGQLNRLLPTKDYNVMYSAMAMRSNYDIEKLEDYSGTGIELIRVTAHENDIDDGLEFASQVKKKGYKVSINPINIMGYDDSEIITIIHKVNQIMPYQFAVVDTFGSMKRRDLERIISIVDHNLDKRIRLALHLHENMSLSTSLAQRFLDLGLNRPIAIDASLQGMGRIPGNLPIELIADYLNEYYGQQYDIDYMLDAIQDYISPLKGIDEWGYNPMYYLSARHNLHRNYAEYYLNKGDLSARDINSILAGFVREKKAVYDQNYAEDKYVQYKGKRSGDDRTFIQLRERLIASNILVLAPGKSIIDNKDIIDEFIEQNHPIVIAVNFVPEQYPIDYWFSNNHKRIINVEKSTAPLITFCKEQDIQAEYTLNYHSLHGVDAAKSNSLIVLLETLNNVGKKEVWLAGADGYQLNTDNYCRNDMQGSILRGQDYNQKIKEQMNQIDMDIHFLTDSLYQ